MSLSGAYEKFWIGLTVSDAKLRLFRLAFFSVFALDAWLQVAHAPRYGHGDFNVSHFPGLIDLIPTRSSMTVVYGLQAFLGLRIALGGASRITYGVLALLFSGGYFISQLDSYQHHYLLALVLVVLAAFPWPDLLGKRKKVEEDCYWPVRMLLVSLSVMYLFAVVTKLDGEWLNGNILSRQLSSGSFRDAAEYFGWGTMAKLTIATELVLVFLLHIQKLWPIAFVLGIGMHLSFEFSGLRIGLFSYFMVTFYLLLLPDRIVAASSECVVGIGRRVCAIQNRLNQRPATSLPICVVGLGLAAVVTQSIALDSVNFLTWGILVLGLIDLLTTRKGASVGMKSLLAALVLLLFVHYTHSLRDYHRFWGGNERRAGRIGNAIIHYEDVLRIDPSYTSGRRSLARLYLSAGRERDALKQYEMGLRRDPEDLKLNRGAALLYKKLGLIGQARARAESVLSQSPGDLAMIELLKSTKKEGSGRATK